MAYKRTLVADLLVAGQRTGGHSNTAKVKRQIREMVRAMNVDWLAETDLAIALKSSVDRVPFLDLQRDLSETMAIVRARLEDGSGSS